jgi:hypothetical protein
MNAINAKTGKPSTFETVACTRCGGGGNYSFCPGYGSTCFKCGGAGVQFTKRGGVASAFYAASLTVDPATLAVGTKVLQPGVPGFWGDKWVTLTPENVAEWAAMGTPVRIAHTAAEKAVKIAAALAFEATLTKAGTVRKAIEAAAVKSDRDYFLSAADGRA